MKKLKGTNQMENWDNSNLPENHNFFSNVQFVAITEGTWQRKKSDGTSEVSPKWDFITQADETGASMQISVYSSTDKEEIKLNTPYDIIVKRAVGKDGTFYGYSLKGFGQAGQPIPKKEPQSRWQKGQKLNTKAEALKAAVIMFTNNLSTPDEAILIAEVFEAWLNGEYKVETEKENPTKEK